MSFFRKLNTLVQSQINDLLDFSGDDDDSKSRRRFLTRHQIGKDLEGDAKQLRARIDDALGYEDQLQAKIDKLYADVSQYDQEADAAVRDNRETDARIALGRMQQAQREVEMQEAALREHRTVTQELISQVTQLEAILDQAKREQAAQNQSTDATSGSTNIAVEIEPEDAEGAMSNLRKTLDDKRRQLGQLVASRTAPDIKEDAEIVDEVPPPPKPPVDKRKVDADLASRISRLSKPSDDSDNVSS